MCISSKVIGAQIVTNTIGQNCNQDDLDDLTLDLTLASCGSMWWSKNRPSRRTKLGQQPNSSVLL